MKNILITTAPFANSNKFPLEMLNANSMKYKLNPFGRKLIEDELIHMIGDIEVVIAGTEPITAKVIKSALNLKHIARVGVGLDNINLSEAKKEALAFLIRRMRPRRRSQN